MSRTTQFFSMVMAFAMTIAPDMVTSGAEQNSAKIHVVEITGLAFVPESIEVSAGDTVTWVNRDIVPHTATSVDGSWDTGVLSQNASKNIVVTQDMTAAYVCRFHLNMTGTIALVHRVKSGGI